LRHYWVITSDFEKMATMRMATNLGYVVAGSADALAYSDGTFVYSRIIDSSKLNNIKTISDKYYYPQYAYRISVSDLETQKGWQVSHGTLSTERIGLPLSEIERMPVVSVSIPVNIRYSSNDVKLGVMKIEMSKDLYQ
jgi:hypothetical protein